VYVRSSLSATEWIQWQFSGAYAMGATGGLGTQWLHNSPQLTILQCQERPS